MSRLKLTFACGKYDRMEALRTGDLAHQYDLATIRWVQGAIEKAGAHGDPHAPPLLRPAAIEQNSTGRSLTDPLADGAITWRNSI